MTTDKIFRSTASVTVALVVLTAGSALAADNKTYMGSFCVPAGEADRAHVMVLTGGVAATGGSANVVCPIIKNVTDNSELENVTVQFWKQSTSAAKCDLGAYRANIVDGVTSNIVDLTPPASATGTGTKTIQFNNFATGKGTPWASNFTYYTLNCTLPSGDRLQHYQVREAGTPTARAKIYPPTMCRPDLGTNTGRYFYQPGIFGSNPTNGGWIQSAILRTGQDTFSFVCPIVADRMLNESGLIRASISLGRPGSPSTSLTCTLYESGNFLPFDSDSVSYSNGTQFPTQTFDFDLAKSGGVSWARYHIHCTSPDRGDAKILGYRIEEND